MKPELGACRKRQPDDPMVGERRRRDGLVVLPQVKGEAVPDQRR
jgi:hypothetical protein